MIILATIKEHKWAIILAVLAGIIIAYPQIHFRISNQDVYQGQEIEVMAYSPWISWVGEIRDGHLTLGSPFFKDGKDDPYLHQPADPIITAFAGKILSHNTNDALLLARSFFPFILFLVIYAFVLSLFKDKLVALVSPTAILLGSYLLSRNGLWQILHGESPDAFLSFFQPVVPSLPLIFFFGFLLCFWLFLEKKQYGWGILSTLILGLTFYEYFYNWTFLYAFLGVLMLVYLCRKKWWEAKRIIMVMAGGILLAIPNFLNLYRAYLYPTYNELSQRFGILETHAPMLGLLVPFLFVVFLVFFPRKQREKYFFSLALVITPLIVLNQQLITGRIMEPGHYHWRYHIPLAIIFLLAVFFYWLRQKRWEFFRKISAVFLIALIVYGGIFVQTSFYKNKVAESREIQKYGPVLEWFEENANREEVVFADSELSYYLTVYTSLNVFYHPLARYFLSASQERLLDDTFLFYRLDGVDKDEAQEFFFQEQEKIKLSALVFGMYYPALTGSYLGIPDETIRGFVQKYQASLSVPTEVYMAKLWEVNEVEYAVWDKKTAPQWQFDQYPFLEKIIEINDFVIYQKI